MRPIAPAALTILGGFFILIGGALIALLGTLVAWFLGVGAAFFYLGLAVGLLVMVVGVLMYLVPRGGKVWGAIAIVLALVSIPTALAGLVVGFVLVLIGGLLAWAYRPPPAPVEFRVLPSEPADGGAPR